MVTSVLTEGELWARAELDTLRDRRFAPAAIVRFLDDSRRRAAATRSARPALARQARRWTAIGAIGLTVAAVAGGPSFGRRPRALLAWWVACAAMLDWHLGMVETEHGRPRPLGYADALTLARAALAPLAWRAPTPALCLVAGATDALDGPLARRTAPTRLGRDLEGLADACFAAAALRGARRRGWLAPAAVSAELARLGVGGGYTLFVYFARGAAPDRRLTRAARLTAPVRIAGLAAAGAGWRRAAGALVVGAALTAAVIDARAALAHRGRSRCPHAPATSQGAHAAWG